MSTQEIEERLRSALAGRDDLAAAWLFGSRARGTERAGSDVDVAVLLRDDPPATLEGLLLDLQDDLAGELGRPVDLVVMNRAPADLVHRVLRDGELLIVRGRDGVTAGGGQRAVCARVRRASPRVRAREAVETALARVLGSLVEGALVVALRGLRQPVT